MYLPLALFIYILSLSFHPTAADPCPTSPFCESYPACSRDCLGAHIGNAPFYHSFGSDTAALCGNGNHNVDNWENILKGAFGCVASQVGSANGCSGQEAQQSWQEYLEMCKGLGFKVAVVPDGYSRYQPTSTPTTTVAPAKTSTGSSASSGGSTSTTGTQTPSSSISSGGGLSRSDKIALGLGIGIGLPATLAGLGTFLFQLRKYQSRRRQTRPPRTPRQPRQPLHPRGNPPIVLRAQNAPQRPDWIR